MAKLDYAKLSEYSNRLSAVASNIEQELSHLKEHLYSQIGIDGTVWSGDSAAEIRSQFDTFSGKFVEFVALVNTASKNLTTAAQNYKDLENTIMQQDASTGSN